MFQAYSIGLRLMRKKCELRQGKSPFCLFSYTYIFLYSREIRYIKEREKFIAQLKVIFYGNDFSKLDELIANLSLAIDQIGSRSPQWTFTAAM